MPPSGDLVLVKLEIHVGEMAVWRMRLARILALLDDRPFESPKPMMRRWRINIKIPTLCIMVVLIADTSTAGAHAYL